MDFSINNNLLSSYNSYDASADKVSDTLASTNKSSTDDELLSACRQFESYFIEQVFKGMEKMVPKSDNESSYSSTLKEYYQDELISNYASMATEQGEGLGIAQMLYEQMKRNMGE